jgi:hypothetical protein
MAPYCELDNPYSEGSVNTELAAGNVTSAMPCTVPAPQTTRISGVVAITGSSCAARDATPGLGRRNPPFIRFG